MAVLISMFLSNKQNALNIHLFLQLALFFRYPSFLPTLQVGGYPSFYPIIQVAVCPSFSPSLRYFGCPTFYPTLRIHGCPTFYPTFRLEEILHTTGFKTKTYPSFSPFSLLNPYPSFSPSFRQEKDAFQDETISIFLSIFVLKHISTFFSDFVLRKTPNDCFLEMTVKSPP